MHFADQGGLLALISLLLGSGESCHPHLLCYYQILYFGFSPSLLDYGWGR